MYGDYGSDESDSLVNITECEHQASGSVPFYVSPFTLSTSEIRNIILARNDELLTNNHTLGLSLRKLNGNENNRDLENVFINNYYKVTSYLHCQTFVVVARLVVLGLGKWSKSHYCVYVETFLSKVEAEALKDIVALYEDRIKPKENSFDHSKLVLKKNDAGKGQLIQIGSKLVSIVGTMISSQTLKFIFEKIASLCNTTVSWLFVGLSSNLDELLLNSMPTPDVVNTCSELLSSAGTLQPQTSAPTTAQSTRQKHVSRSNLRPRRTQTEEDD